MLKKVVSLKYKVFKQLMVPMLFLTQCRGEVPGMSDFLFSQKSFILYGERTNSSNCWWVFITDKYLSTTLDIGKRFVSLT